MMRVAVIDDEPLARSGVVARLKACTDIEVVAEFADGAAALAGVTQARPDLILIDIEMPGMNGLDVLAALPPHIAPMAILVTAYDNFALRAFTLNVVDYLLKPINDDRFHEAIERARVALPYRRPNAPGKHPEPTTVAKPERHLETFSVRIGARIVFVKADDIEWIEADGDYATLHSGGKTYLVRESLNRLSQKLNPNQFMRIHRSTIARIDLVSEMRTLSNRDALLRLQDGTPLRASRTYIESVTLALQRVRGCSIN